MAGFYDIYGLSAHRNRATIELFFSHFCNRSSLESLEEEWIQVRQNDKYQAPEVELPLNSLTELSDYAEQNPHHAFNFYNQKAIRADITCVFVQFTYDQKVIFGISIQNESDTGEDNYPYARRIEAEIKQLTGAYKTVITYEYPPALSEEEFDEDMKMWNKP